MSYVRRFKYKEIDRFTIDPDKLSETTDNYQHLGYFVVSESLSGSIVNLSISL